MNQHLAAHPKAAVKSLKRVIRHLIKRKLSQNERYNDTQQTLTIQLQYCLCRNRLTTVYNYQQLLHIDYRRLANIIYSINITTSYNLLIQIIVLSMIYCHHTLTTALIFQTVGVAVIKYSNVQGHGLLALCLSMNTYSLRTGCSIAPDLLWRHPKEVRVESTNRRLTKRR